MSIHDVFQTIRVALVRLLAQGRSITQQLLTLLVNLFFPQNASGNNMSRG